MKKTLIPLLAIFAAGYAMAQSASKPLILTGAAEYYIKGVSPNGKWAYGTYLTYDNRGYGFRWNLRNNKVELLGAGDVTNEPTGISNDGTIVGYYQSNAMVPNGAYVKTSGFWKNGAWDRYPNPIAGVDVTDKENNGTLKINAISPDSHYMAGTSAYSDVVVWKDGVFDWTAKTGYTCVADCVSPDGQMVGGWSYEPIEKDQRMPVLWKKGSDPIWLKHAPVNHATSYNTCRLFSSNGKWLLYHGGYNETFDDYKMSLYGLYDCEKDETIEIPCMTDYPYRMAYYTVNANGTCLGDESGYYFTGKTDEEGNPEVGELGTYLTIYKDGKVSDLRKYLENKGVDFSTFTDMASLNTGSGLSLSDDERVWSLRYTDTLGAVHSVVIMFDQNVTSRPPVQLEAQRLSGVEGVLLTWVKPLANADAVKSYNLYRNGQLLANVSTDVFRYVDGTVKTGSKYEYTVKAVYADVESESSDAATVDLSAVAPQAPIHAFARQSRESNAKLFWEAPKSNLAVKNYYDDKEDEVTGFGANDLSFECAIRIPEDEMKLYKSQKLTSVNFYPMTKQKGWAVNVYSKDPTTGELKQLYTQPVAQTLNYGKMNNVQLNAPLALPEGKDIYVAIAISASEDNDSYNVIGEVNGKSIPGSTDLLRSIEYNDPDFFSTYEEALKSGGLSLNTWAIDAVFTPENAQAGIDKVASYTVYVDGAQVGSTSALTYETSALSIGNHVLGIDAVYEDGRRSDKTEVKLNVAENAEYYRPASEVYAESKGEQGITVHWNMPIDKDASVITYAYGDFSRALGGTESMNYDYRARAEYSSNLFKGYDGYKITALRFYPCGKSDFTLILYADDDIIAEIPVDINDLELYSWNDIKLPTPVEVQQGVKYSFEIDCYDTEKNGTPLAVDNGVQVDYVSNLISTDEGKSYNNLYANNGNRGNWLMGLKLESDEERPLNVAGFNVFIDNKKVNTELVQGDSYDYTPARMDSRSHRLRVDAVYNVKGEVQGSVVIFTFTAGGPEGINDATVPQISVDRNGSQIQVNGADVQGLSLVGMDGKTVSSAAGNTIDVTHVQAGSYVLTVKLASGEVKSQKLMIK